MKSRKVVEWVSACVVGIIAISLILNRGGLFPLRHSQAANLTGFNASTNAVQLDANAQAILAKMTQDEKLGQLIIPMSGDTGMSDDLKTMIVQDHIGGFFISSASDAASLRAFTNQMQATSQIPMIISTDFEGASWNTLNSFTNPPSPPAIGASGNTALAKQKGVDDARILNSVGINVNYAPVVDVLTNPNNPILQGRTFGTTPDLVTNMASAYIDGLSSGGIAGCLKHFPGLGSSTVDPHHALPTVDRTLEQMQQVELVPYADLLKTNHVPMIMTTHMLIPSLDPDLPTSISPKVINGLLRQQMGYDGVVVSDALFMGGLSYKYSIPLAGLMAFEAGTDMLLGAYNHGDVRATMDLIAGALANGTVTQKQIDTSVLRILRFKLQWHIISAKFSLTATAAAPQPIALNMLSHSIAAFARRDDA